MKSLLRVLLALSLLPLFAGQESLARQGEELLPAIAGVNGVDLTVLVSGEVNLYPNDPVFQGYSILGLSRYQLLPGESIWFNAVEGDPHNTDAGIAVVEYGTASVTDSQGNNHVITAPGTIFDTREIRNESLDCTWLLGTSYHYVKPAGGGGFTDAKSLLLPASVPCDEPATVLGSMAIPLDTPSGRFQVIIGEIEFEPGFDLTAHTEDGFVGIAVERGELSVESPEPSPAYESPETSAYFLEGHEYAIQADADDGATGLIYGYMRKGPAATITQPDHAQATIHRNWPRGFAYFKQRYTEFQ